MNWYSNSFNFFISSHSSEISDLKHRAEEIVLNTVMDNRRRENKGKATKLSTFWTYEWLKFKFLLGKIRYGSNRRYVKIWWFWFFFDRDWNSVIFQIFGIFLKEAKWKYICGYWKWFEFVIISSSVDMSISFLSVNFEFGKMSLTKSSLIHTQR